MYLTQVNRLRNLDKETFQILKLMSRISKNLYNVGLYNIRQKYIFENKFVNYYQNYFDSKSNENYQYLVQMGQCVLRQVDFAFRSFFELLKLKKEGKDLGKVNLPKYLPKDGYYVLIFQSQMFKIIKGKIRLSMPGKFKRDFNIKKKYLWFKLPKHIKPESIKEIKIVPHYKCLYFTMHITYQKEVEKHDLNYNEYLSIDLGVNNFATCITTLGSSFILDGKYVKSINQGHNKYIAKYKSILDKQYPKEKRYSKKLYKITQKRNNRIEEVIKQYVNFLVKYCIQNKIGNIIVGNLQEAQNGCKLGKITNQNFVQIPFGKFIQKLKSKCELYGIFVDTQDESYTSQASALDNDEIPDYDPEKTNPYKFSGKRISRGLYKSSNGKIINADINSAANILRKYLDKSNQNLRDISQRLARGLVNRPVRIRYHHLVDTTFSPSPNELVSLGG